MREYNEATLAERRREAALTFKRLEAERKANEDETGIRETNAEREKREKRENLKEHVRAENNRKYRLNMTNKEIEEELMDKSKTPIRCNPQRSAHTHDFLKDHSEPQGSATKKLAEIMKNEPSALSDQPVPSLNCCGFNNVVFKKQGRFSAKEACEKGTALLNTMIGPDENGHPIFSCYRGSSTVVFAKPHKQRKCKDIDIVRLNNLIK